MSPWPRDGFGLDRMRALLAELGDPQDAYPAIHVVGTNGKSTATVTIEQLLLADGLSVGATISPHVASWSERIRIDGAEADFEVAVARVRAAAERLGRRPSSRSSRPLRSRRSRTQVSTLPSSRPGSAAATTRRTSFEPASCSSRTSGSTTRTSSATRSKRSQPRNSPSRRLTRSSFSPTTRSPTSCPNATCAIGGAREAAEAFAGHAIAADPHVALPGRFERRDGEIRDGAHNPDGARHLVEQLHGDDHTVVASILADKDVDAMLRILRRAGRRLVATTSSSARALPADDLAELARAHFDHVEVVDDPVAALARAHELGEPVLVTGLALPARRPRAGGAACGMARVTERLAVLAFAALIVAAIIGIAFARRVRGRQASAMTTAVAPLQLSLDDPNWTLFRNIGIGLVVVLWLATAYWTFKDARRRIEDPWLVGLATLVGLFPPFLGPIIYMFFRPPEYIQDARERELEIKAMEERLSQLDQRCPVCRAKVEASYLVVPGVHDATPACVSVLRAARRVAVADLPVLRRRRSPPTLPSLEDHPRGLPAAPEQLGFAAAWPAKPLSSSSSRTACAAASPARSSRASSAVASSCGARVS